MNNTTRRNLIKKIGQASVIGTIGSSALLNSKKVSAASKSKI